MNNYKKIVLESLDFDIKNVEQCTKIIIPENLNFTQMDDKKKITINFINDDISLIFTSENTLNIIDRIVFKFNNNIIINLVFKFKSIKFTLHYLNFIKILNNIRDNNLGIKIKLYFSCNFICENDMIIDCQNIIELKINDVLYNFSSLNLNNIFNKNRKFSSLILKNMKLNSNQQVENFFHFIYNPKGELKNLTIKNFYIENLDYNVKLLHYIKIINNQIYISNKGNDIQFHIDNIIFKQCPLCVIENNEEIFNNINISIDQTSFIKINFCGIVKYKYIKDKGYELSFNYDYLEDNDEKDENKMEIETTEKDNNKLNNFESLKRYINNKNLKCYKFKFSNFKKQIEIGYKESIEEIYFEYCSSEFTQSILDSLPNIRTLKLKGITENNCIKIPQSIQNLIIKDSYFDIQQYSLMNLKNLTLSFYCLNDIKDLYNQKNEYDKTILSIQKILKEENIILKNIIFEGDSEIFITFNSNEKRCINNEFITFKKCIINIHIFDYIKNLDKEFIFFDCMFQENDLKIFNQLNIITFDYYTFNKIFFSQIEINDIDDFVQNLYYEKLEENFCKVQKRLEIFQSKKIKIITKNLEEYRKIIIFFLIFKNSKFKSIEEVKNQFNTYFKNNIIICGKEKNIPIILSDYYLSKEQIEFIKDLKNIENIEIIINK